MQIASHITLALVAHMLSRVESFNTTIVNLPIPVEATALSGDRKLWATTALTEEVTEFSEAETVDEQADALMDMIYFALGRLTEMGVPSRAVFDAIDAANHAKVQGSLSKRPGSLGHDAVKPAGWEAPDHSWLLEFSLADVHAAKAWKQSVTLLSQSAAEMHFSIEERVPRVIILGHARHGKDTVCEMLRDDYGFNFQSSSQWAAEHIMIPHFHERGIIYASVKECYEDRVNHRSEWFDAITAFNTPDLTALGKAIFEDNDVYCGIRNAREFHALKNAGVFDYAIWVDRSMYAPPESGLSCTVEPWMADFVLDNNGSLEDLDQRLDELMTTILENWSARTAIAEQLV